MYVNKNDQIVEIDVDDTLVIWDHPHPDHNIGGILCKIHDEHVRIVKQFHARGQYVIVWSDGGYDWALRAVKSLGLETYVDEVRSKSKWHFDDKPQSEWNTVRCYKNIPNGPKIDLTVDSKK